MSISFNQIPVNLRVPGAYVEIDNSRAVTGLGVLPAKLLVFGQMLATGTATALEPTRILSVRQARALYGRGSMLARMLDKLKGANDFTEVWAMPLVDLAAGVQAKGALRITGAPTAAGTISLLIAGSSSRSALPPAQRSPRSPSTSRPS